MKKLIPIGFLFVFGLLSIPAKAQLADKLVPHMGFMYEFLVIKTLPVPGGEQVSEINNFYNFQIGAYYAAFHKNDRVSVGIDPAIQLGLRPIVTQNNFFMDYRIHTPIYIMGKVGAGATKYNSQGFGFGAGIGGDFTFLSQQVSTNSRRNATFVTPSAVAQVSLVTRGNMITARFHISLAEVESTLQNSNGQGSRLLFKNIGVGLLYNF